MAILVANAFRTHDDRFRDIKPDPEGRGIESKSRAVRGLKRLDVNFSTAQAGLLLGVSLKSVHVRDKEPKHRFHHNCKRNDEELRVEAAGYHQRQPYAVLVAVIVLPFEACDDADGRPSSFGTWVQYLWPLARRGEPHGDVDRFEHVFVALYDPSTAEIMFADVEDRPPKQGRPQRVLTMAQFVDRVTATYDKRNALDFKWDTGEQDPIPSEEEDEEPS